MDWKETKKYIQADIYRNTGSYSKKSERKLMRSNYSTVALLIYFRICHYFYENKRNLFQNIAYVWCNHKLKKLQNQCGIEINKKTKIGYGLRLPHKGGIVIHPNAVIGNNCEIMQGVTIGNNILKDRDKVACIGDEVLLCAGAKIIGNITIGNGSVIGANAVVTKNIESGLIAGGVPAKVIGPVSGEYVINKMDI